MSSRTKAVVGAIVLTGLGVTGQTAITAAEANHGSHRESTGSGPESRHSDRHSVIVWNRVLRDGSAARIMIGGPGGRWKREVTHSSDGVYDLDPELSPDGRRILFERDYPDGSTRIVVMGIDGRGKRVLDLGCVDPCVGDQAPSWTPDGRHVVWTRLVGPFDQPNESARSAVLWVSDLRGRHIRRLSPPGIDGIFEEYHAEFGPSGDMVLVRIRNSDIKATIIRRSLDGERQTRLTRWSLGGDLPDISPTRRGPSRDLVVFETYGTGAPDGVAPAIATVPADCHSTRDCADEIRYLTSPHAWPAEHFNPAWSPDGRRIVFARFTPEPTLDIFTMRWNGTDRERVTRAPAFDFRPDWGPSPSR